MNTRGPEGPASGQENPCAAALLAWRAASDADAATPTSLQAGGRWAVGFSGGADSTALLLAAHACWPGQVLALHVNHGLQAAADAFERHAQRFCLDRGIVFESVRVHAHHAPGESPEDAARRARYQALADAAQTAGCAGVWLAQHADDQLETVLLALSRGAGLPGLAAMPTRFTRHGMRFERPLLDLPGTALRRWLLDQGHPFVDDPSNTDLRYTRNRIRARIVPALLEQFPSIGQTVARSARHAAQAQRLLTELGESDLAHTGVPPRIAVLQTLSPERQANLLRHWLRSQWDTAPSEVQMDALLRQIRACTTRGHRIRLKVGSGFVTRQGAVLGFEPGPTGRPSGAAAPSV